MRYIDLTHTFTDNMPVYPGDPKSELKKIADLKKQGFVDHQLNTGLHVGTHIDAPMHMLENGETISSIPLQNFFGKGKLIDVRGHLSIEAEVLSSIYLEKGDIVLFFTGFSEKFHQDEYYDKFPELTQEAAKVLVKAGVSIIGLDTPSPDRPPFETHKILLGGNILIIENLTNLDKLIDIKNFEIIALPAKFSAEAAPVRVIALLAKPSAGV